MKRHKHRTNKHISRLNRGVMDITKTGALVGVSGMALHGMGAPASVGASLASGMSFMPVVGTAMGAGTAMGYMRDTFKQTKKRRRRR